MRKNFFLLIVSTSMVLLLCGLMSDLYLGDETFHYRAAKYIYQSKTRPVFDPLTNFTTEGRIYYVNAFLWHTVLASLWKLFGGITKVTAQIYQSIYYIILVISTYLLAKKLYDGRKALYAALLVATIPMAVALSIILHIDIPIAALTALCLLMLAKRYYFLAGVILGLAFLTKRNIYLLMPAIIFIAFYYSSGNIKKRVMQLITLAIPLITITAPDFYFRYKNFGHQLIQIPPQSPATSPPLYIHNTNVKFYDISDLSSNPVCLITFFGIVLLISVGLYLIYKRYSISDFFLWAPIISYIILAVYFTKGHLLVRYLSPILAPLAIIGSVGFSSIKSKWIKYILITGCVLQFVSASLYTYVNRTVPPGLKQAYTFINNHAPYDSRIMCPRNALALYTNRISIWYSYASLDELPYLFWEGSESEVVEILRKYNVNYILIEKDRIYDDSKIQHLHGYPKSFVERMSSFSFLEPLLENKAVSLWKVRENQ